MAFTTIQLRRDTAANWTSVNPVLHQGEIGFETDTYKFKIGDGSTAWSSLAYFTGSGTVSTTGSPASGNLTKFSGASSITNGDLSGDVTTSGTLATTVAKIQGTTVSGTTGSGNVVFSTSATLVTPALGTPTSGVLSNTTSATLSPRDNSTKLATTAYADNGDSTIPQNIQSAAYTTVLSDAGKAIYHPAADTTARTFTIDSNANVAYAVGTCINFINEHGAGVITIAITSDTMRLAGTGATGSRTLAADGVATAYKMTSTSWLITGTGLT